MSEEKETIENLSKALQNEDPKVRMSAAGALWKIGDARAIDPLLQALQDKDDGVRTRVAEALGKIGDTQAIEPLLQALQNEDNTKTRREVIRALRLIGKGKPGKSAFIKMVLNIASLMQAPQKNVQTLKTIASRLTDPVYLVSMFLNALKDESPSYDAYYDDDIEAADYYDLLACQGMVGDAFVQVVPHLQNFALVIPHLQAALKHENAWVRVTAARAIAARADEVGNLAPLVPVFREAVEQGGARHRGICDAVIAVAHRIEDPSALIPALADCAYLCSWRKYGNGIREHVVGALGTIGRKMADPTLVVEAFLAIIRTIFDYEKVYKELLNFISNLEDPLIELSMIEKAFIKSCPFVDVKNIYWRELAIAPLREIAQKLKDPSPVIAPLLKIFWDAYRDESIDLQWPVVETLISLTWRLEDPSILVTSLVDYFDQQSEYFPESQDDTRPAGWLFAAVICRLSGVDKPVPVFQERMQDMKTQEVFNQWAEICGKILTKLEEPYTVLPALLDLLTEHSAVAAILGVMGAHVEDPKPLLSILLQQVATVSDWKRHYAVWALGKLSSNLDDPTPVLSVLFEALQDEGLVQETAIFALGELGGQLDDVVPVVTTLLELVITKGFGFDGERISITVKETLDQIVGQLKELTPVTSALLPALKHECLLVRSWVAEVLGSIGWTPVSQEQKVTWACAKQDWESLIQFGEEAIPCLLDALQDKDLEEQRKDKIVMALGEIAKEVKLGDTIVITLIKVLQDPDWDVRETAAWALGELGDARAIDPLIEALQDANKEVRRAAAKALGELGDARVIDPLTEVLQDKNLEVQKAAQEALARLQTKNH